MKLMIASDIHGSQLSNLPVYAFSVHHIHDLCHRLGAGVIAASLAPGTGIFRQDTAFIDIAGISFLINL